MDSQKSTLDYTGERMVPELTDNTTFWEHIYRYRFATQFVKDKRVLDIACGEGYGSAALQRAGAASVIGVDISEQACAHARRKYGLEARVGDATNIPLQDKSVDVIVSFETIEHIEEPSRFLDECVRVLSENGIAVISTPNKNIFNLSEIENPFHLSEMDEADFVDLLNSRFGSCKLYSQRPHAAAWWSPRGLALDNWLLQKIRGGRRIKERLRALYCSQLTQHNTNKARLDPTKVMTGRDKLLSSLFNVYEVRSYSRIHKEEPTYLIAVVGEPKQK